MGQKILKRIAGVVALLAFTLMFAAAAPGTASAGIEPYLGEIRIYPYNFAPKGWAQCNGQLLPINQNQTLFSLLGTTYGGDGMTTFALPDLRGRVPIHMGGGYTLGEEGGQAAVTLKASEMPVHDLGASTSTGNKAAPGPNNFLARAQTLDRQDVNIYTNTGSSGTMFNGGAIGGSQAHPNMQPYLTVNFCIALQGIFPSQN